LWEGGWEDPEAIAGMSTKGGDAGGEEQNNKKGRRPVKAAGQFPTPSEADIRCEHFNVSNRTQSGHRGWKVAALTLKGEIDVPQSGMAVSSNAALSAGERVSQPSAPEAAKPPVLHPISRRYSASGVP
jgi:hypothetical protein